MPPHPHLDLPPPPSCWTDDISYHDDAEDAPRGLCGPFLHLSSQAQKEFQALPWLRRSWAGLRAQDRNSLMLDKQERNLKFLSWRFPENQSWFPLFGSMDVPCFLYQVFAHAVPLFLEYPSFPCSPSELNSAFSCPFRHHLLTSHRSRPSQHGCECWSLSQCGQCSSPLSP